MTAARGCVVLPSPRRSPTLDSHHPHLSQNSPQIMTQTPNKVEIAKGCKSPELCVSVHSTTKSQLFRAVGDAVNSGGGRGGELRVVINQLFFAGELHFHIFI